MSDRLTAIVTSLEELGTINTGDLIATLKEVNTELDTALRRVAVLTDEVNAERSTVQALRGMSPRLHLTKWLMDWCDSNDCEPEDYDDLVDEIEDDLSDLCQSSADRKPDLWGKERTFSVEVTVIVSGTVEVKARSRDHAMDEADEAVRSGDAELDSFDVEKVNVEDVRED